jgi:maltose-binding protein MalE
MLDWLITGILLHMNRKVSILLFMLLWLTVSCDLVSNFTQPDDAENTPEPATNGAASGTSAATGTPSAETAPDIAIPTTAVAQTPPSLRVWLPPEIALSTEEGAAILNAQLAAYRSNHPDVQLTIEQKSVSGQSSILNYIRTGHTVAPEILPDLIAIPIDQLTPALSEQLIYPFDGLVDTALLEDLYPAALDLVLKDNRVSGYPFILTGLPHLAYNSETITRAIPTRWEALTELPNSFVFPANGTPGGLLGLEFYLAAGGTFINDAGQVALQVEPLATALQQLFTAKISGFILDQSSNYSTLQESWQLFQAGTADFALTSSEQYLRQRDEEGKFLVTAVPGLQQQLTPLLSGWAWAITTTDPTQRQLVSELLNSLLASDQLGEWSYASNYLPARQAALAFWPQDDAYVAFAREQLNRAQAMPFSSSSNIMTVLNNAVFDVVTLAKTPQVAAEEAAAALQP